MSLTCPQVEMTKQEALTQALAQIDCSASMIDSPDERLQFIRELAHCLFSQAREMSEHGELRAKSLPMARVEKVKRSKDDDR